MTPGEMVGINWVFSGSWKKFGAIFLVLIERESRNMLEISEILEILEISRKWMGLWTGFAILSGVSSINANHRTWEWPMQPVGNYTMNYGIIVEPLVPLVPLVTIRSGMWVTCCRHLYEVASVRRERGCASWGASVEALCRLRPVQTGLFLLTVQMDLNEVIPKGQGAKRDEGK